MTYISDFNDSATAGSRADIDQQNFTLLNIVNFVVWIVFGAHNALQECCFNVDFNEDLGHHVRVADDVADHVVGARELRVYLHTDSQ